MGRVRWIAEVDCEYGGPTMIAEVSQYLRWTGAMPYELERRRVLHYWGQFTDELPAPWAQDGGHVYRPADGLDMLRRKRDALIEATRAAFPDAEATVDDEDGEAHILLPDGRQMWIELSPKSQYEEACNAGEALWEHVFRSPSGREGRALFFEQEGSGTVSVGVDETRQELVLLRTWVDDDAFEDTARALVDAPSPHEQSMPDAALTVTEGSIVIAYSPHSWLQLVGEERLRALQAELERTAKVEDQRAAAEAAFRRLWAEAEPGAATMLAAGASTDVAAVLSLRPGTYDAHYGAYDPDDVEDDDDEDEADDDEADDDDDPGWSCVWCRLTRRRD